MKDLSLTVKRLFNNTRFPEDAFYLDKFFEGRKIVVYGAGESFHYFHEVVMKRHGYKPAAVLDRKFRSGDSFMGIPAFSPDDYTPPVEEKIHGVAVVCLGHQPFIPDVVRFLRDKGFQRIITLRDIYEIHNPFQQPEELTVKGFRFFLEHKEEVERAFNLMCDGLSRLVFVQCLKTHMTRKPVTISMRPREEQYTPLDVPLSRGYSRLIYCGASPGEMKRVLGQVGKIDELLCFEPHPRQFQQIVSYLHSDGRRAARRITVLPCAVYSHEAILPFHSSETSFGSRIVPEGPHHVQTVSLDKVVAGFQPTFISMDVEGAELEALKGAAKIIRKNRPDLAICVYHSPSHLWEVPLLLAQLSPAYRFFLRNYTSLYYETVLYAAA